MTRRGRTLVAAGIPLLVIAVVVAAWAIDSRSNRERVARNVELAGSDIGGHSKERLTATVRRLARRYATTDVKVDTVGQEYTAEAGTLGLVLDEEATVDAAMAVGDGDAAPLRPATWLTSFVQERSAPLRFRVLPDVLKSGLDAMRGPGENDPKEPTVVPTADGFRIVSGSPGVSVDSEKVGRDLLRRASSGELPIVVRARAVERQPRISDDEARAFAAEITMKTARPLLMRVGGQPLGFDSPTLRSWVTTRAGAEGMELGVDEARVAFTVASMVTTVTPVRNASFTVDGPTVTVVPSQAGLRCCATDLPARVRDAIADGAPAVDVDLQVEQPTFTTEMAQALGIKEPVGTLTEWKGRPQVKSFTTYYTPGQSRVRNIQLMADAVRGAVIKPGETFSLNEHVGKRTAAKGYVEAGVIQNGVHDTDIGGGVSQFSTTLFNAAFFAGLDFVTYQSHTIHFDRYPYGREATLGHPDPDQKIRNDTPYGVLIWPTYTPDSITVTLYSTQNVFGQQTAQTRTRVGRCTRVTTTRTRTWADGRTATDTVGSTYRPAEGVNCP